RAGTLGGGGPAPGPAPGEVHRARGRLAAEPAHGRPLLHRGHGLCRALGVVGGLGMSLISRRVTDEDAADEEVPRSEPVPGTDLPHEYHAAPVPATLIRAHVMAGLGLLLVAVAFGLATSWKFHDPEFLGDQEWATWGRVRANHVQGILLAWLVNGFMAFAYFAVPTLTNRPILSARLGWMMFWFWNIAVVLGGWTMVSIGLMQAGGWGWFAVVM